MHEVLIWLAITIPSAIAYAALIFALSPRDKATGYLIRPWR